MLISSGLQLQPSDLEDWKNEPENFVLGGSQPKFDETLGETKQAWKRAEALKQATCAVLRSVIVILSNTERDYLFIQLSADSKSCSAVDISIWRRRRRLRFQWYCSSMRTRKLPCCSRMLLSTQLVWHWKTVVWVKRSTYLNGLQQHSGRNSTSRTHLPSRQPLNQPTRVAV